jgi:hypothetical protein
MYAEGRTNMKAPIATAVALVYLISLPLPHFSYCTKAFWRKRMCSASIL